MLGLLVPADEEAATLMEPGDCSRRAPATSRMPLGLRRSVVADGGDVRLGAVIATADAALVGVVPSVPGYTSVTPGRRSLRASREADS